MDEKTALVLGSTGMTGSALVDRLAAKGWQVLAVARNPQPSTNPRVIPLAIDLTQRQALADALQPYPVTHVFFAAFIPHAPPSAAGNYRTMRRFLKILGGMRPLIDAVGPVAKPFYRSLASGGQALDPDNVNLAILRNVVEVTSQAPHHLQHVALVTGGKIYGMHLSPHLLPHWKQPFRESDPRPPGPNFYFDQEDYLQDVVAKTGVTWSVARPAFLIGDNPKATFNLVVAIAVYASILKAQQMPLIFPGDGAAANCLYEMSDADLVADLLVWSSVTPAAHNQAFNAVNGQPIRWRDLWPVIADCFEMKSEIRAEGYSAQAVIGNSKNVWQGLVTQQQLLPYPLEALLPVSFFDLAMVQDWDTEFSMDKARQMGFSEQIDNAEMFRRHFQRLREKKVIP